MIPYLRDALAAVDPDRLVRFLATRRWFGAKDRAVASAALRDVAVFTDDPAALACVRVQFVDGGRADYQLPLAVRDAGDEADVVDQAGIVELVDAPAVPAFLRRLAQAFARGETVVEDAARWTFEPLADLDDLAGLPPRIVSGEQSNTSIVYGDRAILKIFRHVEVGKNPDVEIGRFLTARTRFRGTPTLLGAAYLHTDAGPCVTAMIQEFMPGAVDGWSHVLARLRAGDDLTAELNALGAVTRELHAALASVDDDPEFAPEPTREDDLQRWRDAAVARAHHALALLARQASALPSAVLPDIRRVLAHAPALVAAVPAPPAPASLGPRTRHHGDYHLGQVLHTASGWRIIDFEGEPARPLAERRAKHHPLRDVAGMLRSFAYAAAVAVPDRAAAVERSMSAAFLAGYDDTLLADPPRAALLALFTSEKLFYELTYELGSRPAWVWIPLAGVTALLPAEPP
jgi:trehalose synthase-fused probable maltokinase